VSLSATRQALEEVEARRYADLLRRPLINWSEYNRAIIEIYSVATLRRIKRRAWEIVGAPEPHQSGDDIAKMDAWETETRAAGVWRDIDADAQMCVWVRNTARAALAALDDHLP